MILHMGDGQIEFCTGSTHQTLTTCTGHRMPLNCREQLHAPSLFVESPVLLVKSNLMFLKSLHLTF